mmetsp:Transcript_2130/g.3757  ORF Transcript_2130/g.3757 Transcript_2130/m.3757 type:complete len:115 (+) Transcript_2130:20-364(+)
MEEKNENDQLDEEEDDDFECDIEKYVPYEDKISFTEKLKISGTDCLTQITKLLLEIQPQAVDDFDNGKAQLKIDLIDKDAFLKCLEILEKFKEVLEQNSNPPILKHNQSSTFND